jgi:hypothetical protein
MMANLRYFFANYESRCRGMDPLWPCSEVEWWRDNNTMIGDLERSEINGWVVKRL